jgi:hypothetical protein
MSCHIARPRPFPRENFEPLSDIELSTAETGKGLSMNVQVRPSTIFSSRTTSSYSLFSGD